MADKNKKQKMKQNTEEIVQKPEPASESVSKEKAEAGNKEMADSENKEGSVEKPDSEEKEKPEENAGTEKPDSEEKEKPEENAGTEKPDSEEKEKPEENAGTENQEKQEEKATQEKEAESNEKEKPEEKAESNEKEKPEEKEKAEEKGNPEKQEKPEEKAEQETEGKTQGTSEAEQAEDGKNQQGEVHAIEDIPEKPKRKLHVGKIIARIILGTAVTAVAVAGGYYGYGAYYYANHFYSGTTAVIKSADDSKNCWTEDLSDLTVEEARERISSFTDGYVLTIGSVKGTTDTISADAIGYQVTEESLEALQTVMQGQDYPLWIIHMTDIAKASVDSTIDIRTEYNEEELGTQLDSLQCIAPDHVEKGTDAYLNYNEETYLYEIVDSVSGNQGDEEKIREKIEEALETNCDEVELEDSDYVQPAILSDNADLIAKRDAINQYLKAKITVSDNGSSIVVDGSVIINFLNIDEDWNVTLDETKITTYVNQNFDAAFDTRGTTRTVNLLNSGEVTMSTGTFGDFVQTTAEVEKLVEEISAGETVEREPCYYNNYEVEGNGGIGSTYIDVNITQQKVYVVVNDQTVLTTDCVTGLTNGTRDTPTGFYFVWWKTTNYTMTTYNSFVYYWMPIDETGVGLHDATWRSSFGGSIYKSSGSHGCINLPKDMAAKIYDIAYVGIPVVVHK